MIYLLKLVIFNCVMLNYERIPDGMGWSGNGVCRMPSKKGILMGTYYDILC